MRHNLFNSYTLDENFSPHTPLQRGGDAGFPKVQTATRLSIDVSLHLNQPNAFEIGGLRPE